jgi:type I restriction enzyme S subunit
MNDLPQSWVEATVDELVLFPPPRQELTDDVEVGFVPLRLLGTDYLAPVGHEPRRWGEVSRGYTQFVDGDILVARITPSFENGKSGIPRGLPNGIGAGSTEYMVLRPLEGIVLPEFLMINFKTTGFLSGGQMSMTGAVGQQRVPAEYVRDYKVGLAPMREQQRLVSRVLEDCRRLEEVQGRLHATSRAIGEVRARVHDDAVSGALTSSWRSHGPSSKTAAAVTAGAAPAVVESPLGLSWDEIRSLPPLPTAWRWVSASEIVDPTAPIVYGIIQPGPDTPGGAPYVRGTDIQNDQVQMANLRRADATVSQKYSRSRLSPGDVLLGIIRSTKVAIVPTELDGGNITQGTARLRPSTYILSKYLAIALRAPRTQAWLQTKMRGIDMPGLNLADVRRAPIPLPPIDEQREIVARTEAALEEITSVLWHVDTALRLVNSTTSRIFDWASTGRITAGRPIGANAAPLLDAAKVLKASAEATKTRTEGSKRQRARANTVDVSVVKSGYLAQLLKRLGPSSPELLWASAGLSVDDFYRLLAEDIRDGIVRESRSGALDEEILLEAVS